MPADIIVMVDIPPVFDPWEPSIDKIAVREAIRALLFVALPERRVIVLTPSGSAVESLCFALAVQVSVQASMNLSIYSLDSLAQFVAKDCFLFILGGGVLLVESVLHATQVRCDAGFGAVPIKSRPVASTGGVAKALFLQQEEVLRARGYAIDKGLAEELVYDALFRRILAENAAS